MPGVTELVHRGAVPPSGPGTWVPAPRSRALGVSWSAVAEALHTEGTSRPLLEGIARLLHAEHRETLDGLKEDYRRSAEEPEASTRFLRRFLALMREGEFVGLDDEAYRRAVDQRFLVDIPVRVRWKVLATDWLARARKDEGLAARLDELRIPEAFEDRALFFHRGHSTLEVRGWHVAAKLDLALVRLGRGLLAPIRAVTRRLFRGTPDRARPNAERWLLRIGLGDTPWWSGLLSPATLAEPCFRQVVLLYRRNDAQSKLTLKLFRDIPLADAEMVFPERRLGIRTLDAVLILGTAIAAAPAIVRAVSSGGGTAIALATVLGGYAAKLVGQYLNKRRQHRARVTKTLYDKSQDNDVGVLQYLVDTARTQSTSEVALVVHHLRDGPARADELDARIEAWLQRRFEIEADYDVDDALRRAKRLGLVEVRDDGTHVRRTEEQMQSELTRRWSALADG